MEETTYGITRKVNLSVEEAEKKVRETLKKQGFGILTEIDVQKTLKEKIGAEIKPYKILGACNPSFAHKAIIAEKEIGLLLPCNVIIYEDDSGATHVAAMDPKPAMALVNNPIIEELAGEVRKKIIAALEEV